MEARRMVTPLSWSEEDGSILKWDAGYAAYKAFMREYSYGCNLEPAAAVCRR